MGKLVTMQFIIHLHQHTAEVLKPPETFWFFTFSLSSNVGDKESQNTFLFYALPDELDLRPILPLFIRQHNLVMNDLKMSLKTETPLNERACRTF